jgi:hypothetical protein
MYAYRPPYLNGAFGGETPVPGEESTFHHYGEGVHLWVPCLCDHTCARSSCNCRVYHFPRGFCNNCGTCDNCAACACMCDCRAAERIYYRERDHEEAMEAQASASANNGRVVQWVRTRVGERHLLPHQVEQTQHGLGTVTLMLVSDEEDSEDDEPPVEGGVIEQVDEIEVIPWEHFE